MMTFTEIEEFLLFAIMVAGKPAKRTSEVLAKLLSLAPASMGSPFGRIEWLIRQGIFGRALRRVRCGQYRRINRAMRGAIKLDPRFCTVDDLEAIPGIGPKTARFFLLHTRPGVRYAALDTHVLKHLRALGVPGVPKTTPGKGPVYARLERAFLRECDRVGKAPADYDLEIWNRYTKTPFTTGAVYERAEGAR